ncbi:IS3 family transposase [Agrobacterium vitis]|uniref:IS3 family transposase n=1 Tax=Agrobacterium vitis TaxID=373 RepID=A0AAE2RB02_AGRVI|nr:IS3 family transposase [Agrobacterium vitis]MBF2714374.1 IS3 family transposase [Agrobacterium vitis]MUZ64349.1 IS3 family transposase [Agrobacterium vitis]MVA18970.1 IS3 family transposase [Agrobacterium vitis]
MEASKFTEAQIAFVLKQAHDGPPIGEVCRKAGISDATFYNWRKKYAGLMPSEMKRLRQLEEENAKLKRIVADLSLDKAMLQDVLSKKPLRPDGKRHLVDRIKTDWKVSIRRACSVLKIDRSLYVYKSKRGDQAELKLKIKDICQTRVRYGYRRVHVLIRRDGWVVNPKRIYRLYKEMDLQLRNKVPKRRVKAKLRSHRTAATRSNDVWAMDFVHDQLATGRKIRVLTVVDTFSRFFPAVDARFSYKGEDVMQTLERVCRQVGYPATIRVDNGSEFISRDLDLWAYHRGVVLDFSRPGKPTDNSYIESFNGKFRAECLNAHWFMSLDDARSKMEDWRRDYNEFRPHSAIGNKVPISLLNGSSAPTPT